MNAPEGLNLSNWREHPFSQWSFQHVPEVVPSATIPACTEMEQNFHQASGTELFSETTLPSSGETLQVFLKKTHTDGIMIAHKGSVVASWYAPHFDPTNTHILYSVSKSITATVAGILQHQGLLDPASPVSDYLPIPAESAYSDCTVQHVLDMTVALDFEETYAAGAQDFRRYRNASGWDPVDDGSALEGLRQFIFGLGKLDDQHGRIFRYRSPNSDLLGMILTSCSGSTFPELMSELLWKPIGAKTEASITLDHYQDVRTAGGISVTIDDLTTMGQVICDGGKSSQGNQILPEAWINEIIDSGGDREAWKLGEFVSLLPKGNYHNKWWQSGNSDQVIYALGIHGQYLYINPLRNLVISCFSSQPTPLDTEVEMEAISSFDVIASNFS